LILLCGVLNSNIMAIINHDNKNIHFLEQLIKKDDGTPLMGEIDMYRRIICDCEKSESTWHFWHDLTIPISIGNQTSIQIDFLLLCEKGMAIIEVKGGRIGVVNGNYYYESNNEQISMNKTPFQQADDYLYALINNKIVNKYQVFLTTICAFPHTAMSKTSNNPNTDLGWKLWSKIQQENENVSFADFCIDVIEFDKRRKRYYTEDLSKDEMKIAVQSLTFNFTDNNKSSYRESSLQSILDWLKIDNLSTFKSLQKNERIVIEGGPGTGKTTIAKAYINKYRNLRGIYLCWNKLLGAKVKYELEQEGLLGCEVCQFASFVLQLQKQLGKNYIDFEDIEKGNSFHKISQLLSDYREQDGFIPFDYIVIDEAQDILDKGIIELIDSLCSITEDGVRAGKYIMFYDPAQAYGQSNREINDYAEQLSRHSAHFVLDENKRVPYHKEIVEFSEELLNTNDYSIFLDSVSQSNSKSISINCFTGARQIIKHINGIKEDIENNNENWNEYVLLAHSSTKKSAIGESLYDRIASLGGIKELTEKNIFQESTSLSFTSILSYKGLENKHVILLLNKREYIDSFELYIGVTRAIEDLEIIVLE
jgi:hypothetical protein